MEIVHGRDYSELGYKIMEHNATTPLHWHKNFELCELLDSPCDFLVDGQSIEAKKGDIITIREKDVHGFFVNQDTSLRIIQFSPQIFLNTKLKIKPLKKHITAEEIDSVPMLRQNINHLFGVLENEGWKFEIKDNPFFAMVCESVYLLLMRHFSIDEEKAPVRTGREAFFETVEFVNNHYTEDININIIAEHMLMSRNRVVRMFETHAGKSLKEYIDMLRVDHANRMINNGSNVTEAAIASGFQCIRTFNNVYKTYMGVTPSEYMRQTEKNKKAEQKEG